MRSTLALAASLGALVMAGAANAADADAPIVLSDEQLDAVFAGEGEAIKVVIVQVTDGEVILLTNGNSNYPPPTVVLVGDGEFMAPVQGLVPWQGI